MPATTPADGLYIGVMSGTSFDGVDLVIARFSPRFELLASRSSGWPPALREAGLALCRPGTDEIDRMGHLDRALGEHYAALVGELLERNPTLRDSVVAIGCHGQTVRHRPGTGGFSLQLGSGDVIAARTGIPTVNNFRNHDMVLGGEGAPLVPGFHGAVFGHDGERRAIVNIGGMANVTLLDGHRVTGGYDTGPGNVLMDAWIQRHRTTPWDADGAWARSGRILPGLLDRLLEAPYFSREPPKSTGREDFNAEWLASLLPDGADPGDVQATLLELTARTVADQLRLQGVDGAWVCGGGARNGLLMDRLRHHLAGIPCCTTADLGLEPELVEASAFAWLARARILGQPGNVPAVTGASRPAVLGALYLP